VHVGKKNPVSWAPGLTSVCAPLKPKQHQIRYLRVVFTNGDPTSMESSVAYRILFSKNRGCVVLSP
jgi:hypothetical protein